jgi:hypothetical protein
MIWILIVENIGQTIEKSGSALTNQEAMKTKIK